MTAATDPTDRSRLDRGALDAVLQDAVDTGGVPHVAAVVADRDGLLYDGAAGPRAVGEDDPLTVHTRFRLMSMTKTVATTAALQQVEKGALDLDAPVDTYCAWSSCLVRQPSEAAVPDPRRARVAGVWTRFLQERSVVSRTRRQPFRRPRMTTPKLPTQSTVCIAGCGPAGAMLGLLLARAGVDVVVLEKHEDFHRDFRGDTIHASTLQVLDELGLLAGFEALPQQRTTSISILTDSGSVTLGDFRWLPGRFQWVSMVPQWDFLTFLVAEAEQLPTFHLLRRAEVVGLVEQGGQVRGVRYRDGGGVDGATAASPVERELRATLTVAADGRHSAVRRAAGLGLREFGVPIDVLWYRLPKRPGDPPGSFARLAAGRFLPMIDRGSYWQGACTMPKGTYAELRGRGVEAFRADLRRAMPFLGDRLDEALRSWDDTGFLEVRVDRLRRWHRPGLLCIGDAAHAMSPVAGVGINLAIQDAVATANLLVEPLLRGTLTERDLARVQRRRELPTRITQRVQRLMQRQLIAAEKAPDAPADLPRAVRLLTHTPPLVRLVSRFMAIGIRNEHVAPSIPRARTSLEGGAGSAGPLEPAPQAARARPGA